MSKLIQYLAITRHFPTNVKMILLFQGNSPLEPVFKQWLGVGEITVRVHHIVGTLWINAPGKYGTLQWLEVV